MTEAASRQSLETSANDYTTAAKRLVELNGEAAELTADIEALVRQLPPDEQAARRQSDDIAGLKKRVEAMNADLQIKREAFAGKLATYRRRIGNFTAQVKAAFDEIAGAFLIEDVSLSWTPMRVQLGQAGTSGVTLTPIEYPSFSIEMTGANFLEVQRRDSPEQVVPNVPRASMEPWNREKLKNRRIVLPLRQLGPNPGDGSVRTITCVLKSESANDVIPVIRKYVKPGSTIHTDDGKAYSVLSAWYDHATVRHSAEYSTDAGVNNNQAECFISRMRRAEYGVYHGMRPTYLAFYAAETAWLDDHRRLPLREKLEKLLRTVLNADISRAFRGYCQGRHLGFEYLG